MEVSGTMMIETSMVSFDNYPGKGTNFRYGGLKGPLGTAN